MSAGEEIAFGCFSWKGALSLRCHVITSSEVATVATDKYREI